MVASRYTKHAVLFPVFLLAVGLALVVGVLVYPVTLPVALAWAAYSGKDHAKHLPIDLATFVASRLRNPAS
jgi:hypothetical protein